MQYGKTGDVNKKQTYKCWGRKDSYYAAYNVHALTIIAKREHPEAKICLVGNDFGAMLSLYLIKEFPEVIDHGLENYFSGIRVNVKWLISQRIRV